MELEYASGKDLENGWLLSVAFLEAIQTGMESRFSESDMPSLKQIEGTLISFRLHKNTQ